MQSTAVAPPVTAETSVGTNRMDPDAVDGLYDDRYEAEENDDRDLQAVAMHAPEEKSFSNLDPHPGPENPRKGGIFKKFVFSIVGVGFLAWLFKAIFANKA